MMARVIWRLFGATGLVLLLASCSAGNFPFGPGKSEHPAVDAAETAPDLAGRFNAQPKSLKLSGPLSALAGTGLTIHIFAAGQADAMLIIGPAPEHKSLLVDLGEPVTHKLGNAERLYPELKELLGGKTTLDYVLITHFHQDHAGSPGRGDCGGPRGGNPSGLFALFDQEEGPFAAKILFDPGEGDDAYIPKHNSIHCGIDEEAPQWLANHVIGERRVPSLGTSDIDLGQGVSIEIVAVSGAVYPGDKGAMNELAARHPDLYSEDEPASENDRSIAFILHFGGFKFFSGGDLTGSPIGQEGEPYELRGFGGKNTVYTNVESYLVRHWRENNEDRRVDVYRADHHGSGHSSNADLATALNPAVVIMSSGPDNGYGHPDPTVVNEFCDAGAREYVTSGIDSSKWPGGFPEKCGAVVGDDINIEVPSGGGTFSVNGDQFTSRGG